jgi:ATP-dependent RNA helicase RhlE
MSFKDLGLEHKLLRALQQEGYTHPTPIQTQAIPILLQGRDLIGCAQTGTGKTAAFSLPLLQMLAAKPAPRRDIRALILAPTRELAIQIDESLSAYGRYSGLRNTVVFGGVSAGKQISQLRQGVDVLVATPGRLLDLRDQGLLKLDRVEILVLDEADRMLDMGFIHDMNRIISRLPTARQTLLFSATMSAEVREIADKYLRDPRFVSAETPKEERGFIEETLYHVEKPEKAALLIELIQSHQVAKGIVFTRTKYGADKLARVLSRASISVAAIHGNKSQNQRQAALEAFKAGRVRILVASDIAARGIDIEDISHIFNYEIPEVAETYVHRIGRTGRAGAKGVAISLCDNNERKYMQGIQRLTQRRIPVIAPSRNELSFR